MPRRGSYYGTNYYGAAGLGEGESPLAAAIQNALQTGMQVYTLRADAKDRAARLGMEHEDRVTAGRERAQAVKDASADRAARELERQREWEAQQHERQVQEDLNLGEKGYARRAPAIASAKAVAGASAPALDTGGLGAQVGAYVRGRQMQANPARVFKVAPSSAEENAHQRQLDAVIAASLKSNQEREDVVGMLRAYGVKNIPPGASMGELKALADKAKTRYSAGVSAANRAPEDLSIEQRRFAEDTVVRARSMGIRDLTDERLWTGGALKRARALGMTQDMYQAAIGHDQDAAARRQKTGKPPGFSLQDEPSPSSPPAPFTARGESGPHTPIGQDFAPFGGGSAESALSDADLWEKKVEEGMSEEEATAYVTRRKR